MKKMSDKDELDEDAAFSINEDQELAVIHMRTLVYGTCHATKEMHTLTERERLGDDDLTSLADLIQSSTQLDKSLVAWEHQTSVTHPYHNVDSARLWPSQKQVPAGAPKTIHVYSSISIAAMWNLYRTTRLYLLKSLRRAGLRLMLEQGQTSIPEAHAKLEAELTGNLQRLSNDVCGSIPYMLGEVDQEDHLKHNQHNRAVGGMFLLWPLGSLLPLGVLPPEQIAWIQERLVYIRNGLGIQHGVDSVITAEAAHT